MIQNLGTATIQPASGFDRSALEKEATGALLI
jgi:hypothetical protein